MRMKKFLVLALSLVLIAIGFSSCEKPAADEEILSSARTLVADAAQINDIFYGEGIPYAMGNDGSGGSIGNYSPADPLYLEKIGVKTVEDLKKMTSKVYSEGVCNVIFETKLSSVSDGTVYAGYAEYIELPNAGLSVYVKRLDYINAECEYKTDTLKILEKSSDTATLSVEVTLTNRGQTQEKVKEFKMIKTEDGEWLLDSMTYIAWYEEEADLQ